MHKMIQTVLLLLALAAPLGLRAQEQSGTNIPDEVFYLIPSFSDGYVFLRGQIPAQGKMNICAVDNTLRYLDENGTELAAAGTENIVRVQFDTVCFLQSRGVFYRMYPLTSELGIALKREVKIIRDVKQGAFGMSSQTSSIQEYGSLYTEGGVYSLNENKTYPYTVSETLFLYKGDSVYIFTKNNLKKLFPEKKTEIEAWFKAGNSLPQTPADALALIASWAD